MQCNPVVELETVNRAAARGQGQQLGDSNRRQAGSPQAQAAAGKVASASGVAAPGLEPPGAGWDGGGGGEAPRLRARQTEDCRRGLPWGRDPPGRLLTPLGPRELGAPWIPHSPLTRHV